jgi:hypothetical protein
MKDSITNEEYLQLKGLKMLANNVLSSQRQVEDAISKTIGEERDEYGNTDWSNEFTWDENQTVEFFLRQRGISIQSNGQ